MTEKKVLLVGAEDDPIIAFSKTKANASAFPHGQLVNLGKVLTEGIVTYYAHAQDFNFYIDIPANEKWRAHSAENQNIGAFRGAVEAYIKELAA